MYLSRFNIIKEGTEDDIFIYNTLTGSVLRLNSIYAKQLKDAMQEKNCEKTLSLELMNNLRKGKMIVDDDVNEISLIISQNYRSRFSETIRNYTIAPTMKCNFRCPYCYEQGVEYTTMDRNVIEGVKKVFEQDRKSSHFLSISWYGGEPLVAFDIIEELSIRAIELYGDNYFASMVTNGYLLSKEIAQKLEELRIFNIQITIDGPPDVHNKRRRLPNGKDTFFVIMNNMRTALNCTEKLHITVRVNTDKTNILWANEILNYIEEYGLKHKVSLYLAPVDNVNNTCNPSECFSIREFAEEQIKFIESNFEKGYNFAQVPQRNLSMCGAVSSNGYVIDAKGDIYKCWDDVGNQEMRAGNILNSEPLENINLTKWLSYSISDDKECMECSFLPVCMGGCPNYRIKYGIKKCIPIKENVDEMIKLIYAHYNKKQCESEYSE